MRKKSHVCAKKISNSADDALLMKRSRRLVEFKPDEGPDPKKQCLDGETLRRRALAYLQKDLSEESKEEAFRLMILASQCAPWHGLPAVHFALGGMYCFGKGVFEFFSERGVFQ